MLKTYEHFIGFRDIEYSAIMLDNKSKELLLSTFKDIIPNGWIIQSDHMTICLGELPTIYRDYRGEEVKLTVTHLGISDKSIAVKVNGFFVINRKDVGYDERKQHITIAFNPKYGPKYSNEIEEWKKIIPFKVKGVVEEKERKIIH
jgi:sulfur carrier protein ThiS